MSDFSKIKPKDKMNWNTEYNLIKSHLGSNDTNALIMMFDSSVSQLWLMKALGILLIVVGIPTIVLLVGFGMIIAGVLILYKVRKVKLKYKYLTHLAKTDPDLTSKPASNHPSMQ